MSILNQAAVEALCSATYLENYLETMDNLPDDLQRIVTQLRELDIQCRSLLQDTEQHKEVYLKEENGPAKKKAFIAIQRTLVKCQEIGDEKLHLLTLIHEFIENRHRQLDQDRENLGILFDPTSTSSSRDHEREEFTPQPPVVNNIKVNKQEERIVEQRIITTSKRQRRQKNHDTLIKEEEEKIPKKKKKRKTKKDKEQSPIDPPIDPDEPLYCLCQQVSYGEMIGCDNDACAIEWFHFNCVGLTSKPKGKWFCPKCRGDTCKVMRKM
ncbi:inhibitor of growth protein 1-like [Ruditapes philippinarum]|uniref:inhibitor of growth protein 1-like n=1 Tax=Ruditapes philippinarum TaxID=129788 RepID=UPI00295B2870|nr:inhibitor of growth protein 1-like [Ruditapes philippinarum]